MSHLKISQNSTASKIFDFLAPKFKVTHVWLSAAQVNGSFYPSMKSFTLLKYIFWRHCITRISTTWCDIGADILHVVLVILASSDRWDRSQSSYAITISNISWYYKIHWNGLKNRVDRDVWLFIQELLRKWAREHCKIPTLLVLLMRRWLAYHLVLVFHFVIFALANAF